MSFHRTRPWTTIVPIDNLGLTNDLFLVNKKLFVKKSKSLCHRFLNLKGQIKVAELLQSVPYTLPIIDIKIKEGHLWTVLPFYYDLMPLSKSQLAKTPLITFANLINHLHAEPITHQLPKWDALKQLATYCHLNYHDNQYLKQIETRLIEWLKNYQPSKLVLCHNDLSINNFVIHENIWYLIDWDFAAVNDPWFDVASFASETLTTEQERADWYQLFAVTKQEQIIINYWVLYQNLIWYYWSQFLFEKTNDFRYQTIVEQKWLALNQQINWGEPTV